MHRRGSTGSPSAAPYSNERPEVALRGDSDFTWPATLWGGRRTRRSIATSACRCCRVLARRVGARCGSPRRHRRSARWTEYICPPDMACRSLRGSRDPPAATHLRRRVLAVTRPLPVEAQSGSAVSAAARHPATNALLSRGYRRVTPLRPYLPVRVGSVHKPAVVRPRDTTPIAAHRSDRAARRGRCKASLPSRATIVAVVPILAQVHTARRAPRCARAPPAAGLARSDRSLTYPSRTPLSVPIW